LDRNMDKPPDDLDQDWLAEDGESDDTVFLQEGGEAVLPVEPPSPYGVKLDGWGKRQGRELLEQNEFEALGLPEEDLADLFGMSFEYSPELAANCQDPHKAEFLQALMENPEYQALHGQTMLDTMASELASMRFGQEWGTLRKKREEQEKQDQAKGEGPDAKEQLRREMQAMAAANTAAKQASQEVQELQDMQESLGIGSEAGAGGKLNPQDLKKTFLKLKNNRSLKEILDLAGKYRLMARSRQRNKVIHGYDELVGVTLDGDISRMLAHELAQLGHPLLEMDAIRRFAENEMLCREYRGVKRVGKGPIMIFIDESGSMGGSKIAHAKAMALAMGWIAQHQKRWCAFVGWANRGQTRVLALPPGKWETGKVLDWLSGFLGGGTHLPIEDMPGIYAKAGAQRGKTDIIVITDGELEQSSDHARREFTRWKEEVTAKIIGISIQQDSRGLKAISDEYYRISSLSVDNEAVGAALSI
jgi:uncharacterized protein with von Willebrand factor type A (vWA) domain